MFQKFIFLWFLIIILSCKDQREKSLLIATSANMRAPMEVLVKEFKKDNNINVELSAASSGTLTAQIQKGAPFDVFASADLFYPTQLSNKKLTLDEPYIYAYGQLCLCTMNRKDTFSFSKKYISSIENLAVANPKIAPYGRSALQAIKALSVNPAPSLVYGEHITQAAIFTRTGAAEAGILSQSFRSSFRRLGGFCEDIDPKLYEPIAQAVVVLKNSNQPKEALAFQNFILSKRGKEILKDFGYSHERPNK